MNALAFSPLSTGWTAVAAVGRRTLLVPVASVLAFAAGGVGPATAATVDIFLIASQSTPSVSTSAPFTVQTSSVYQLGGFSGQGVATSAKLVDDFSFDVAEALTYNKQYKFKQPNIPAVIDEGEPGSGTAALANSEVGTWDDVGIAGGGDETHLDMGRNTSVIFNSVVGGFRDLVLADSGGLNSFKLFLCPDAVCSTAEKVFGGLSNPLGEALLGMPEFAPNESTDQSEMDQAYLFRFSDLVTDFVRVTEEDYRRIYTGERLEIDYLGVGGGGAGAIPVMPVPESLPLLAGGLALLGLSRRRRRGDATT